MYVHIDQIQFLEITKDSKHLVYVVDSWLKVLDIEAKKIEAE